MGRKTSIRSRILRLSLISIFVMAMAMLITIIVLINKAYDSSYRSETKSLAEAYCKLVEAEIDELEFSLEMVQNDTTVVDESIPIEIRKERLNEIASTSRFKDYAVAYKDGHTYNNTDISDREYFKQALNGKYYVSAPLIRKTDNSVTTMMAGPVFTHEGQDYVIYGGLDSMYFSQGFDSIDMGEGSGMFVIDNQGQVVASSNLDQVKSLYNFVESEDEIMMDFAKEMMASKEGFCKYKEKGVEYLVAYKNVEGTDGWTLAVTANYSDIKKNIFESIAITAVIIIALMLIGIVVSIKVANNITKPVVANTRRLRLLSEGDVTTPFVNNAPNDETYVLSESMVSTVTTLKTYITDIREVLLGLAAGDLTVRSDVQYLGDFAEIGTALNQISSALNTAFTAVKNNVGNIRSGAEQLSNGAQTLSDTATQESQAVADISAIINKINDQADETAEISAKATELTQKTNDNAISGGELMKELLLAVEDIRDKSHSIAAINNTISDIASQTKILALNASVEAARAGSAGKSFAVVAGEVGSLAAKSQAAAKQTDELITASVSAADNGAKLAKRAYDEMSAIIKDIGNVTGEISGINAAAAAQKDSIHQISSNMSKIESGMQMTTSTAEESAASSEELSAMSSSLAKAVSRYKTR